MRVLLLPLFLFGCGNDISVTKQRVDDDSDGYAADVDCDDAHATVNPDAPEVCDGLDNDCNGVADDGASDAITAYADVDGDGFGDEDAVVEACDLGDGVVAEAGDCDDAEAGVFPGADETCNTRDDDCDGAIDEEATDGVWVHADADGDGHGDAGTATWACEPGAGEVTDGTDCDDADAAIHPGAPEEDCTDPTDYNCDGSTMWADADADGWAACEDCDDAAAGTNPAATEVCDGADVDEDCSGLADDADPGVDATSATAWTRDADGDAYGATGGLTVSQCEAPTGYAAVAGDCDDTSAGVNPGAAEVCDARDTDEDCDTFADDADVSVDSATWSTWYGDSDGDGYGDPTRAIAQCDAPATFVADDTDCDDGDVSIHPGAGETCDAADTDEDCDGLADDADAGPSGTTTWYADDDGDTYGDAGASLDACDAPTGFVADARDCDDLAAAINPAATEVCDAADTDEDCDGLADDADPVVGGTSTWYADADADGYGGDTSLAACAAPAGYLADTSDCDDTDAAVSPAGAEACNGIDDDCDGLVDDDDTSVSDPETWYRDADGDGHGGTSTTAACITPSGYAASDDDCDDTSATVSPDAAETCGDGIDQDCDGADDTCPGVRWTGSYVATTGYDVHIRGMGTGDNLGTVLVAGDFDGNGQGDLIASMHDYLVSPYTGTVVGYYNGFVAGSQDALTNDDVLYDTNSSYWTGVNFPQDLANLGDQDGDGGDDLGLLVSYNNYPDYEHSLLVFHGAPTGTVVSSSYDELYQCESAANAGNFDEASGLPGILCGDWQRETDNSGIVEVYVGGVVSTTFTATSTGQYLGRGVAGGDDIDGDGVDDVWFGTDMGATSSSAGAAYLFFGPQLGTVSVADADHIVVGSSGDWLGNRGYMPGDLDGDGAGDLAVGAWISDTGGVNAGSLYIITSPASGTASAVAAASFHAEAGDQMDDATFGDFDGDGTVDVVTGARYNDERGSDSGAVWAYYGPVSGQYLSTDADATWAGYAAGDNLGVGLAAIPDTNGDGFDELAMGAENGDYLSRNGAGYVAIWYGE